MYDARARQRAPSNPFNRSKRFATPGGDALLQGMKPLESVSFAHGSQSSAIPAAGHLAVSRMLPDNPLSNVRCAFSSKGLQFAVITPDGRIRTFDTVTGRLQSTVSVVGAPGTPSGSSALSNGHLADAKQCLAWLEVAGEGAQGANAPHSLLAVGTGSGAVEALSSEDGKLKWSTADCGEGGVTSICATSKHAQQLWATGRDGQVCCLHSRKGTLLKKFKGSKHGATAAAISSDGSKLLLGSSSLVLLDAESGARLGKLTGHPGEVRAAAFAPSGAFAVSAGSGERTLAVWATSSSKAVKKGGGVAVAQLAVADAVQHIHTAAASGEDFWVAAVTEQGEVYVWLCSPSSELQLSAKQVARVHVGSSGSKAASHGSSEVVLAAHLDSNKKGNATLLVVRGATVKPVFERIPLNAAAEGGQVVALEPTAGGVLLGAGTPAAAAGAKAGKAAAAAAAVVQPSGPAQVLGPDNNGTLVQQRVAAAADAAGRRKRSEPEPDSAPLTPAMAAAAAEADGLGVDSDEEAVGGRAATLEQMVAAMEQRQEQYQQQPREGAAGAAGAGPSSTAAAGGDAGELPDAAAAAAAAFPAGSLKADSLVSLLQQALRSADKSLLERCLNVSNDRIINNSVRRLVPMDAALLLREAVARLQSKPSRGQQLAAWVRAVLLHHTAYLMSAPGVQPVLTSLYQTIEARLALQRSLLSLAGRLDLLLAQAPASAEEGGGLEEGPEVVYEESDSEEEVEVEDVFGGEGGMYSDDEEEDEEEDEDEGEGEGEEGSLDDMEEDD